MKYFNQFFIDLPFYKSLDSKKDAASKRLHCYLKEVSNRIFQQEINKWLKLAYEQNIVDGLKQRLSGNVTFITLQSVLNELMVAYFMQTNLGMNVKRYSPLIKSNKMADWLFEKGNQEMYAEVKTPWEESREGTFFYSQYKKLFKTVDDGYEQRPEGTKPFVIFITDELNISPVFHDDELIDVLYGKRAIIFHEFDGKTLKQPSNEVVDKRSIFQQKIRRSLSAVAILRFTFSPESEKKGEGYYLFRIYHNPYCFEQRRLNQSLIKSFKQYVPNFDKGEMEWISGS